MKTTAAFTHDKVRHDQDGDVHLVLTLTAPKKDWKVRRPPVCVIPVIDNSGSMSGDKLHFAKQSVLKLIDQLQPGDYCGIVAFESRVHPIAPPREMTQAQKDDLKAKVGSVQAMGGTNFAGGMCQGLEWACRADLPTGSVNRVIMFTDGRANEGVTHTHAGILELLRKNLGKATASAFGYGQDADQELLADFAKSGSGNYAFIRNPDDALSAFAKELGGLLSTYAQNIEVVLEAQNGHVLSEVLSDVDVREDGGKVTIRVPDILAEEVRQLVVSVKLKQQPQALPREMTIVNLSVSYDVLQEDGTKARMTESLKARVQFVKPGEEQKDPNPELNEAVGKAQLVKAQIEAEARAKAGDFGGAESVMLCFSEDMGRRGLKGLADIGAKIGGRVRSKSLYAASAGYRMSVQRGATRAVGTSGLDGEAQADLIGANYCLENSAQADMVDAFRAEPRPAPDPVPADRPSPQAPSKGLSKSRSHRW